MVLKSYLQLKMLIYNNHESINLQKKLWDKFYINAPELPKLSDMTTKCDVVK